MSKVNALYHIVFCTKRRQMTLPTDNLVDLYKFIWREVKDSGSSLLRIGGIENHVHMLIDLHPGTALSDLVRDVKSNSSGWMRSDDRFSLFVAWAAEYYACSVSPEHKNRVVEYIKGQREHHCVDDFDAELVDMYSYAELPYHENDMQ